MLISGSWIEVLIRIVRADHKTAGIEFINPGDDESKIIASYILSK